MIKMYGLNYCADHTNGKIYEYSLDVLTDDGEPIVKQRDSAAIHGGLFDVQGKKLFFDMVEFVIVRGETQTAGTGLGSQAEQFDNVIITYYILNNADTILNGTDVVILSSSNVINSIDNVTTLRA